MAANIRILADIQIVGEYPDLLPNIQISANVLAEFWFAFLIAILFSNTSIRNTLKTAPLASVKRLTHKDVVYMVVQCVI